MCVIDVKLCVKNQKTNCWSYELRLQQFVILFV